MTNQTWVLRVPVSAFTFGFVGCEQELDRRYLDVQGDNVDGNTDALIRNAARGSTPTVVVFQNVLHNINSSFRLFIFHKIQTTGFFLLGLRLFSSLKFPVFLKTLLNRHLRWM